jgi:hypothetical protein
MENLLDTSVQTEESIILDRSGIENLNETRKWTMFLSILGFIFLGLMILGLFVAIFALGAASRYGEGMGMITPALSGTTMIPAIILAAIWFFPLYYLMMFSKYSALAARNKDSAALSSAMKYLKLHYRFVGILTIVVLSLYLIIILIAISVGGFMGAAMR